ncbi:MAG: hypothetical protein K5622_01140 [Endomicrobiaceae bacterium]|nr:hypothetical protein [Endomicrobiaceae bacterium]
MKKTIKILSLLCTCLLFFGVTNSFAGTDAAAFLKKSVGVKAVGMGGAFTSVADDTSAVYWNPAGLAQIQDYYSIYAMGTTGASDKYPGLKDVVPTHQFFAVSIPLQKFTDFLGKTVIGVGYISSKMDNIQHTSSGGEILGKISDTDNAYYLSAGIPLWQSTTSLYVGASLKYITKNMSDIGVSDGGLDIDAGVIYSVDALKYGIINFGAIFQKGVNIGDDSAPMTTKVGVSDKVLFADKFQLTGAVDLVQRQEEPLSTNVGLEFGILDVLNFDSFGIKGIFLRGGLEGYAIENRYDISADYNETVSYNFGLGFDFAIMNTFLQLDIAICSGNIFDQNTKFALNFFF